MEREEYIFFHVDAVESTKEGTLIRGWAFSRNGEVQISICDDIHWEIKRCKRPDVVHNYSERYGFDVPVTAGFEILMAPKDKTCVKICFSDGEESVCIGQRIVPSLWDKLIRPLHAVSKVSDKLTVRNAVRFLRVVKRSGLRQAVYQARVAMHQPGWQEKFLASRPSPVELARQRKKQFGYAPVISLIVPVYNPEPKFLKDMIKSVMAQTYSNWELCLADGSTEEEIWHIIQEYTASDKRIKAKKLEKNQGISGNSNAALELASGEYIALFDHDDLLTEEALYEVVQALNPEQGQRPDFIYTDEDKTDKSGKAYFEPHFKPDFSPEFLDTNNYICHFTTISRELIEKAGGGFRPEYDGAQDFDLVLRTTELARCIVHIPKVVYHWRVHEKSTAGSSGTKGYTHEAGRKALMAHLVRLGRKGVVKDGAQGRISNVYKIDYELAEREMVSIIIPNYNHKEDLSKCLESIWAKTSYSNYEIIVVENNSTEPEIFAYYDELESSGRVRVLRWPGIFNYAAINNWAAAQAKGQYILLLNNDIEIISPDWIEGMMMYAQFKDVGAVGGKLYYPDGTIQHAGVIIGLGGIANHSHLGAPRESLGYFGRLGLVQNVSAVTAAMLLVRREVFEEVKGFDEDFVVAFNDVDLCLRIREAGYRNVFTPEVEAWHYESKSRGRDDDNKEKRERFAKECEHFYERWGDFPVDPYYNVNLTLSREDFSLR